ncbi:MAG: SpoIIE family protein phosphatase, partial [Clostridia bacterium]|nr:SpoIIE family protein phosphatase [Clostridia bacterium]
PEQARTHPDRNVITRAVGVGEEVDIDVEILPINACETVLICTDGLYEYISDDEMYRVLKDSVNEEPAKSLVEMANNAGGKDNITVVTVEG